MQAVVASAALWQQEISISSTNVIPFSAVLIDLSSFHHFKPFCVHFACNSPLSLCTHALKRGCTLTQILQDSTLGPVKVHRPHNCRMPFFWWQHQITPAICPAQRCVHSQQDGPQGTAVMHCPLQTFFFLWSSCSRVLQQHRSDVCRAVMLTTQHLADGSWLLEMTWIPRR